MIKRILLITAFAATMFTSPINAGDVDCDAMVAECMTKNPYISFINPIAWSAYQLGCSNAGDICKEMQG